VNYYPSIDDFASGGERTPLQFNLPNWATGNERNYHHALRRLFETSDWELGVHSSEISLSGGKTNTDVLLRAERSSEYIGIEVKTDVASFNNSETLNQLKRQAESEAVDRLYACAPETKKEVRLDVLPETKRLANLLGMANESIELFRGMNISKVSRYRQVLSQRGEEGLIEEAKQNGDLETIKRRLESSDRPFTGDIKPPGGNWKHEILKKVGILRFDAQTGEVRVEKRAQQLNRSQKPSGVSPDTVKEPDVVHALWEYYNSIGDAVVEAKPPSIAEKEVDEGLNSDGSRDLVDISWSRDTTVREPRIDILTNAYGSLAGIEVKGEGYDISRLEKQLRKYSRAGELNKLLVGVPESEVDRTKDIIDKISAGVGLVSVKNPGSEREIEELVS